MKTIVLIVAVIFILVPVVQAQDDGLDRVIAAYESYADWTSYAAQSTIRVQLAYSLESEDESVSRTDSILREFDGQYDVEASGVKGTFSEKSTGRIIGQDETRPSELTAMLDVIGLDGTVYVAGDIERDSEEISIDEPTEAGRNLNALNLEQFADFSEFRNIEKFIEVIQETGSVASVQTAITRQYDGELEVFVIVADAEQTIEALNLNLNAQFADLLDQDAIDREALLDAMAENADLLMSVFLDAQTGALVAENIILLINVEWEDDQIANGSLLIEYSYDYLVLYDEINVPVEITEP